MQPGMAGGAERDQKLGVVAARLPVMDYELFRRVAGTAGSAIPVENLIPKTGKAAFRMTGAEVTLAAETPNGGGVPAAGAEKGALKLKAAGNGVRQGQNVLYPHQLRQYTLS